MDDIGGAIHDETVEERLLRQPHLFLRLTENALTVAESVRDNYLRNTATFVEDIQRALRRKEPLFQIGDADTLTWDDVRGEVVTFIDGGVGQVEISSRMPILLRVGSYTVRTGDHRLSEREQFGYYPIVLGDLDGGSKDRDGFIGIVRITAELLGGLSALERTPGLRVLMFQGPLVYLAGVYAGQTPFTEQDIDLFLNQYAIDASTGREMKSEFLHGARLSVYPRMVPDRSDDWADQRVFEPVAWMAYLLQRLVREAKRRKPVPIIAGVVERSAMTEFTRSILLERVFLGLRGHGRQGYFNELFGRHDLTSTKSVVERLGYSDTLLLGMTLPAGQYSEPWTVDKYSGLGVDEVRLVNDTRPDRVDWRALKPHGGRDMAFRFPEVRGTYVQVSERTDPIRVEVFHDLGERQIVEAAVARTSIRACCRAMASRLGWTSPTSMPRCRHG